jgi:AhpD family alkylhydroperoxidase
MEWLDPRPGGHHLGSGPTLQSSYWTNGRILLTVDSMEEKKFTEINRNLMAGMKAISLEQPEVIKAFQGLHHGAMKTGALDLGTKELMALAIGITQGCEGCIASHTAAAVRAGVSKAAFFETLSVAVLMGGGPALTYASKAAAAYQEFAG